MEDNTTNLLVEKTSILVVDDNPRLLSSVSMILNAAGFHVECAVSGKEALEKLSEGDYDLLLLDLMMPGIDGFQVLSYLSDQQSSVQVIACSGTESPEESARALRLGAYDFVAKPYDPKTLLTTLRTALEAKQTRDAMHILVTSMVGLTGQSFFDKVTRELCKGFDAAGAIIGEIIDGKFIRAISLELDGVNVPDLVYSLDGTPCQQVINNGACLYSENVSDLFPEDKELQKLRIQGYAGTQISDQYGNVIGILWIFSRQPLRLDQYWKDVLNIIAAKAGAEIQRMKAVAALEKSNQMFRALVENTQDFVWEVTADGIYTYCSPQSEHILGYKPEELLGKSVFELMPLQEAERVAKIFHQLQQQKSSITSLEKINLTRDGKEVILETNGVPIINDSGNIEGYRGMDRNITERKNVEIILRESEQRFRGLIEKLPNIPVQGYNHERRVIYWNNASVKLYGYSQNEAIGALLEDLILPESMRETVIKAHRAWLDEGKEIPSGELELRSKDGCSVTVYSSHVLLRQGTDTPEMFCVDMDLTAQKKAQRELKHLATYDQLTQLPNRYLLDTELKRRIVEAQRFNHTLAVVFIDLDNFKEVNDTLGHDYGDALLKEVAGRFSMLLRKYDLLARFGGDEFVLLVTNVKGSNEVTIITEKLITVFSQPYMLAGEETYVTGSVGISLFPQDGNSASDLLKHADAAMYRAKESGRNCYRFFQKSTAD